MMLMKDLSHEAAEITDSGNYSLGQTLAIAYFAFAAIDLITCFGLVFAKSLQLYSSSLVAKFCPGEDSDEALRYLHAFRWDRPKRCPVTLPPS